MYVTSILIWLRQFSQFPHTVVMFDGDVRNGRPATFAEQIH